MDITYITLDEIEDRVKTIIDELYDNESEFLNDFDRDTEDLNTVIRSHINDAYNFVVEHAEVTKIVPNMTIPVNRNRPDMRPPEWYTMEKNAILAVGNKTLYRVDLEITNMLRFVSAYIEGWTREVRMAYFADSQQAAMQNNKYSVGTPDRPVVIASGKQHLKLYSAGEQDADVIVRYCSGRKADDETEVEISDELVGALCYYTAYMTCLSVREDIAQVLYKQALEMMGMPLQ